MDGWLDEPEEGEDEDEAILAQAILVQEFGSQRLLELVPEFSFGLKMVHAESHVSFSNSDRCSSSNIFSW